MEEYYVGGAKPKRIGAEAMIRWLVGLFLVAHGFIHVAVWLPPYRGEAPFNPSRSWLLGALGVNAGAMRSVAIVLALVAGIGFLLGGLGWIGGQGWGRSLAFLSAIASLLLTLLYFNLWLSFVLLINAAILYSLR
ncbi:MAG TPA: hypothetical protein VGR25_10010 [bacterium]|jgi:hypothetical protein|nr:hypothetical protein [bacterium]